MTNFVKSIIFLFLLFGLAQISFASKVLSGGNTSGNFVVGANLLGGTFGFQFEVEADIALGRSFSIAPRLGGTGIGGTSRSLSTSFAVNKAGVGAKPWPAFFLGASFRFGIIQGIRPHGFWIGPSIDVIFGTGSQFLMTLVPTAEFGWRYTFNFGLSLQALIRIGLHIDTNATLGFYGLGGIGIGYAF